MLVNSHATTISDLDDASLVLSECMCNYQGDLIPGAGLFLPAPADHYQRNMTSTANLKYLRLYGPIDVQDFNYQKPLPHLFPSSLRVLELRYGMD